MNLNSHHAMATDRNQALVNSHNFIPIMDRPRSSKYDNPITLKVAVMFLFYILSISLCLSSVSTCICVIFNPVGFFRTIANYILHALGLSIFLTFLFVGRLGYDFDDLTSRESTSSESTEILNVVDEKGLASQEAVDTAPIQEKHHEKLTPSHTMIETPPSTPAASDNSLPRLRIETANTTDGNPHFREESFASPEDASYVAEQMENLPKTHAETVGQQSATANVITARKSKKIEKWIDQTDMANNHVAKAFHGMHNRDDTNHQDLNADTSEITVKRPSNDRPLSETQSVGQDSDFQKALRGFMTKGQKRSIRQEGSTVSIPSVGLSGESEFQGVVRKMFMLEKGKRKGKALSV